VVAAQTLFGDVVNYTTVVMVCLFVLVGEENDAKRNFHNKMKMQLAIIKKCRPLQELSCTPVFLSRKWNKERKKVSRHRTRFRRFFFVCLQVIALNDGGKGRKKMCLQQRNAVVAFCSQCTSYVSVISKKRTLLSLGGPRKFLFYFSVLNLSPHTFTRKLAPYITMIKGTFSVIRCYDTYAFSRLASCFPTHST
jgi:hypothetical protein